MSESVSGAHKTLYGRPRREGVVSSPRTFEFSISRASPVLDRAANQGRADAWGGAQIPERRLVLWMETRCHEREGVPAGRADSRQGGVWGVQVTRVGAPQRWVRSARGERVEEELSTADAVAEIWEAIERKITFRGGILALAVGQPGAHAFRAAVDEFQRKYGRKVQDQVQFSEVWLVGYSPETTVRIHPM